VLKADLVELLQIVEGAKQRQSKLFAHAPHEDAIERRARVVRGLENDFEHHLIAVDGPHLLAVEGAGGVEEGAQPRLAEGLSGPCGLSTVVVRQAAKHGGHLLLDGIKRFKAGGYFQRHTGTGERYGQDLGFGLRGHADQRRSARFANEWLAHSLQDKICQGSGRRTRGDGVAQHNAA